MKNKDSTDYYTKLWELIMCYISSLYNSIIMSFELEKRIERKSLQICTCIESVMQFFLKQFLYYYTRFLSSFAILISCGTIILSWLKPVSKTAPPTSVLTFFDPLTVKGQLYDLSLCKKINLKNLHAIKSSIPPVPIEMFLIPNAPQFNILWWKPDTK